MSEGVSLSDIPATRGELLVEVHNAMTGGVLSGLVLHTDSSPADLTDAIAKATGVAARDQIILVGPPFTQLDPRASLADALYNKSVFFFDWSVLTAADGTPTAAPELSPKELQVPVMQPMAEPSTPADGSSMTSPLVKALLEYEHQLKYHSQQGKAFADGAVARQKSITACAGEVEVQCQALEAVLSNLEDHHRNINSAHAAFRTTYSHQAERHGAILDATDSTLEQLKEVPLHPALATDTRKNLWDCVPVDRLLDWAGQCRRFQDALGAKVEPLREEFSSLAKDVEQELSEKGTPMPTRDAVRECVKEANALVTSTKSLATKLSKDSNNGSSRVQETRARLPTSASQSTDALEACRSLERLHQSHGTDELPALAANDTRLRELQDRIAGVKAEVTDRLLRRLRTVSTLQTRIRDLRNRLAGVREGAAAQATAVAELSHIKSMPASYHACVTELQRRRAFGRQYVSEVEAMADKLARMRSLEVQRRERFLRRHGRHLPRDLVPGLTERPPHAEILARPFDTTLPVIEPDPVRRGPADSSSAGDIAAASRGDAAVDVLSGCTTPGQGIEPGALSAASTPEHAADKLSNRSGTNSTVGSLVLPAQAGLPASDEFSQERIRRLEYENALLKAELSSMGALHQEVAEELQAAGALDEPDSTVASAATSRLVSAALLPSVASLAPPASQHTVTLAPDAARDSVKPELIALRTLLAEVHDQVTRVNLRTFDEALQRVKSRDVGMAVPPAVDAGVGAATGGAVSPSPLAATPAATASTELSVAASAAAGGTAAGADGASAVLAGLATPGATTGNPSNSESSLPDDFQRTVGLLDDLSAGGVSLAAPSTPVGSSSAVTAAAPSATASSAAGTPSGAPSLAASSAGVDLSNTALSDAAKKLLSGTRAALHRLLAQHTRLHSSLLVLHREVLSLQGLRDRIAYRSFDVGDVAMFAYASNPVPSGAPRYIAFNDRAPHRYLAEESMAAFRVGGRYPGYVVGRIVHVSAHTATEDENPYNLEAGAEYFVLTATAVEWGAPLDKGRAAS